MHVSQLEINDKFSSQWNRHLLIYLPCSLSSLWWTLKACKAAELSWAELKWTELKRQFRRVAQTVQSEQTGVQFRLFRSYMKFNFVGVQLVSLLSQRQRECVFVCCSGQRCTLPQDWRGRYFQSGIGEMYVRETRITTKGSCIERRHNHFLFYSRSVTVSGRVIRWFPNIYISQGSVATQLRFGGIFRNYVIDTFSKKVPVKGFWYLVHHVSSHAQYARVNEDWVRIQWLWVRVLVLWVWKKTERS